MQDKTVLYASAGPHLDLYDIDFDAAVLQKRATVTLPANVQYAWLHPSRQWLYVVSSNGGPGVIGDRHWASAFRLDEATGVLQPHGEAAALASRPLHVSVDRTGKFLLIAYNNPSGVTVHRLAADGTIGAKVEQLGPLDTGLYAHQILTTPGNRTAILVTRGSDATADKAEDPGALKVYGFNEGVLTDKASIAPDGGTGFGPRHIDFHPTKPWVFVSVERQNRLAVYAQQSDGTLRRDPLFVNDTLMDPAHAKPGQQAGAIHVHPNGRFVYVTNRNRRETDDGGRKVFAGGENSIAVFAIDPATGEPTLIQTAEGHGIHLRTFGIDPGGRLLVAASIRPILVRDGSEIKTLTAGLMVYRIGPDGRLSFERKYDVDTGAGQQFWSGMIKIG
ncbi:MAG: lactonase family protein [Xanthobacteraceae bacterium]